MKRLLILMAALALGPVASAGIIEPPVEGEGWFCIEIPEGADFVRGLGISTALESYGVQLTGGPGLSGLSYYGAMDWSAAGHPEVGVVETWGIAIAEAEAGMQLIGRTNAAGYGDQDMGLGGVFLLDPENGEMTALYATPEPLTLGLVGVGVLFLRRRQ